MYNKHLYPLQIPIANIDVNGRFLTEIEIEKFSDKNSDIFHISAQNIDCGYSLEPSWRGGYNEYT